jgi:DNA polymerase-1
MEGRPESMTKFIFDTETTGLDITNVDLLGCGYCYGEGSAIKFDRTVTKEWVREQVANASEVIGHNVKYDLQVIGNPPSKNIFDTMVAEWLLYPDQSKLNLKYLGEKYFGEKNPSYKELINQYKPKGMKVKDATLEVVPTEIVDKYAKKDVELTFRLYQLLEQRIKDENLDKLFYGLEMPFLKVLADMEIIGIKIDIGILEEMAKEKQSELDKYKKEVLRLAGEDFNIDSPKQMCKLLYEKLHLPKLSDNTAYATNEAVLKRIVDKHPIITPILEYRKLTKLLRTYLYALPTHVAKDGRVHCSFKQTGTGTGRISCDNPNLQNIPKGGEFGGEIRKAFIPEKGNIFIVGDYDQMELRMLAHVSGDRELIKAFREGQDIHKATAQQILGKDEITDDERRMAKTINFGIVYGMSVNGLAKALDISPKEATQFIYRYACQFSEAWMWRKMQMWNSKKLPTVETILGRKRDLNAVTGIADRMSLNTPIQGSCADLVKIAMIRCTKGLRKYNLQTKLILQVHDELVFEVPEDETDKALEVIKGCMESVNILNDIVLKCPMKVQLDTRQSWFKEEK